MKEYGRIGQNRWDGVFFEEFLPELHGLKGIKAYREMERNDDTVGAILFAIKMLIRHAIWSVEPGSGSAKDREAAEFVKSCMGDMQVTWTDTISEILSFLPYGWSFHEVVYKRRMGRSRNRSVSSKYSDGLIGWQKIPIRSQDTLYKWEYDDKDNLIGMTQMPPPDYGLLTIPMRKAMLFRTEAAKDNPEGRSVLRNAYRSWYFKRRIQEIEAIGMLGGMATHGGNGRSGNSRGTGLMQTILEAKDMATPTIQKVTSKLKSFEKKAWTATFKIASAPIRKVASAVTSPLMAAGASVSAGAMIGSSVKTYAGFESTMSQVKAISGATKEEFAQLTAKAKEMGATTKFTAQEAGEAFNYMAMAGWEPQQMLGGISGIMNLAAASGESLGTTSDIVTDALTAFGLKASDAGHFSDVLAQASSNANTNVGMMGESFKYVAPVAGALGYKIEDTSLALGLMANASIKGSMAGTSLKTALSNMASPTKAMAAAMQKYGVSLTDSEGNMKSLKGVMLNLRESLGGLSETEQTAAASTIFGKEAMAGMLAIINASEDDWTKLAEAVEKADGAAERMADTMLDNLSGKFTLFKSALDGVKISLGERIQPYLVEALDWMTEKMPAAEDALMRGMNGVDRFVAGTKDKIEEFTSTPEWENADLFGKMHIAWDELVGEPFSQWWSGFAGDIKGKAAQIGEVIGEGLSGGLLTLLGIDIGEGVNEGASIGASFAQGFSRGFDASAVGGAVRGSMGSLLMNAGKIFTGDGDASSWASAAVALKTAMPIIGGVKNGVSFARKIFGSETTTGNDGQTIVTPGIGRRLIGSASQGTGLMGLGANTATRLGAGNLAGGASMSAGALSAVGLGAIAGGVVGSVGLISGISNFVKAAKAEDSEEQSTRIAAGALEITGVGAGAAAGAAIGAAFGGIGAIPGALIGAGIGGLGGMLGGHHINKSYDERKATEATMAEKSIYALEGARFETEELEEAFKDASVSADEFGVMMQEAASQKIQDGLGNIKLSLQEIQDAAKQILFNGDDGELTKYATAASDAEKSVNRLQSATSSMKKLNWKASMGLIDDEESTLQYQAGIQSMVSSAQEYVQDQHYRATSAIGMLVKSGTPVDMTSGLNAMYANMQNQLNEASEQLQIKVGVALEDGAFSKDELNELSGLQQQVTDITSQISDAQAEAGMQALKIKYSGGAQLDLNSFAGLTSELQSQVQQAAATYDDALEVSLTSLNMQLESGAINQDQFNAQFQTLTEQYQARVQGVSVKAEGFLLDSVADVFGEELDGILPDIKGTTAEKLGTAMYDAMAHGVDVENWDAQTASKWLDMDGLSAETQSAVAQMMSMVAATMPDSFVEALDQTKGEGAGDFLSKMVEDMDPVGFGTAFMNKMSEGLSSMDVSESGAGLQEGLQNTVTASIENMDLSDAAASLNGKVGQAMSELEMDEAGGGLQEGLANSVTASIEGMDLSGVAESVSVSVNESLASAEAMDLSGFGESLAANLSASASGMDYSGVTSAIGSGVSAAIEAAMGTIQGAISNLYSQVGAAINSAFAAGFQTTTTVTITVNYQLANPTATISFSGGGTGAATVSASIASNAEGSIVNGRLLSWVGEDGPEAIIPLGAKRRQRGMELWKAAGRMLGVHEYAEGGMMGVGNSWMDAFGKTGDANEGENISAFTQGTPKSVGESGWGDIKINVNLSPKFEIKEGDGSEVLQVIRANLKELADGLAYELAEMLSERYENMPVM